VRVCRFTVLVGDYGKGVFLGYAQVTLGGSRIFGPLSTVLLSSSNQTSFVNGTAVTTSVAGTHMWYFSVLGLVFFLGPLCLPFVWERMGAGDKNKKSGSSSAPGYDASARAARSARSSRDNRNSRDLRAASREWRSNSRDLRATSRDLRFSSRASRGASRASHDEDMVSRLRAAQLQNGVSLQGGNSREDT
jgi:hypothetical protein